jgi:hypothetical protein
MLTFRRALELGIDGLEFLHDEREPMNREVAVERCFEAFFAAIEEPCPTTDVVSGRQDLSLRGVETAATLGDRQEPSSTIFEPPTDRNNGSAIGYRTFAEAYDLVIDENKKMISRAGQNSEAAFPRNDRCLEWQLAKALLNAGTVGTTVPVMQERWADFGGLGVPQKGTIANRISAVNRRLELIGLAAARDEHNGPWIIVPITTATRISD